jgi:hypothetical protein
VRIPVPYVYLIRSETLKREICTIDRLRSILTQTQGNLWHSVNLFFNLSNKYARRTIHHTKIKIHEKRCKIFFSVDPARTHLPDRIFSTLSCFENVPRSQEPPSPRDIDCYGSCQLLGLCLKAVNVTFVTIHYGHNCASDPSACAQCGTR